MAVRPADRGDFAAIQQVEARAGELFRDVGMPEIAEDDPPTFEELDHAACLLVAEDAGELVGYALVELLAGQAHLEQLSVLPEHGGRGVGTALINAVVAWARDRGDDAVTLTTFRDVPFNAPLYAKRGFVELPQAEWSEELRALVEEEAGHGLDPDLRVVMRRAIA